MRIRVLAVAGLCIVIPTISFLIIHFGSLDPAWLALPDLLFCASLLFALERDLWAALLLTGFIGLSALVYLDPAQGPMIPALIYLIVARIFFQTLAPGRVPLITQTARRVHGKNGVTRQISAYTRQLTRVWASALLLMASVQTILAILGKNKLAWVFGSSIAPYIIIALFVLEPIFRRYFRPDIERVPLSIILERIAMDGWR